MRQSTYEKFERLAQSRQGYTGTVELLEAGFTNRQIGQFVNEGFLEKVSHGHYWFLRGGHKKPADYKAVEVGLVNPKAVICADSACFYQGLIDIEPETLSVATCRTDRARMHMNFSLKRHYLSEKNFDMEQRQIETKFGTYRIYDIERSVCECIRFRNDIQEDIFEYIVERYNASQERQLGRLMQYARALRVERQAMDMVHKEGAGISVF